MAKDRAKLEQEWADIARQMGYVDFHRLDECDCGGICDCWTRELKTDERHVPEVRYASEWICDRCGDVEYRYYDADMHELS